MNAWIIGLCLIVAGGTLIYLESYKNNDFIDAIGYLFMLGGWICLFIKTIKGTIVDAPKISFKADRTGFFKQGISSFFAYILLAGVIFGTMFWSYKMGIKRKNAILRDQPTNTTVAVVDHLEVRHGRSSTTFYAIFQYTVKGKMFSHPWHEQNEGDFLVGEKFQIKYSVDYPDMFMLLKKLP